MSRLAMVVDVLLGELLEEGRHYAPANDVPCLDEALDGWIGGGDIAEGKGVERDDLHGEGEEKIPIGVAAQVDAPGTVDPVEKNRSDRPSLSRRRSRSWR